MPILCNSQNIRTIRYNKQIGLKCMLFKCITFQADLIIIHNNLCIQVLIIYIHANILRVQVFRQP